MAFTSCFWVWQIMLLTLLLLADIQLSSIGCSASLTSSTHGNSRLLKSFSGRVTEVRRRNLASSNVSSRREVEALIAFKESVISDPLDSLESWHANASSACGWKWVQCSSSSDNVVHLDLSSLALVGAVPQLLGDLNLLKYLDLSSNFLTGLFPDSITNCSNLSYLNVSHNQVTGELPSKLGQLYNLQFLDSSYNNLSGEIPSQLGDLFHLQYLDFSMNNLTGGIPGELGNCSLLDHLDLSYNILEGSIPSAFSKLSNLQSLTLRFNSLSGAIPNELGNCTSLIIFQVSQNLLLGGGLPLPEGLSRLKRLQWFSVGRCNLVGDIPKWVTNFTSLGHLSLVLSGFSGPIPEEIGRLENLSYLDVAENSLIGPIPKSIINCTALSFFQLGGNHLTGDIPAEVGLLSNLEHFNTLDNDFSGVVPSLSNCSSLINFLVGQNPLMARQTIPSWLASLPQLEKLSLENMNLYGEIPADLGQLSNVVFLSLYGNYLGGVPPTSLQNLTFLTEVDISYNAFQGELPSSIFGNMSYLYFVQLGNNFFSGAPSVSQFGNRDNLTYLDISTNLLSGELDWGDAHGGVGSALQFFFANSNNISGPIPEELSNCSYLNVLQLFSNEFSGPIPSSLGNLTNLGELHLQSNKLQGKIPMELMNCVELVELLVANNKLEGSIPWEVGQLVNLEYFDLRNNSFAGSTPSSLANLTKMRLLYLDHNRFTGSTPGAAVSKMSDSLIALGLSHNLFSGSLSPEFAKLANLQWLDLSANKLSGSIPSSLVVWTGLKYLDVSLNNFNGPLPAALGSLEHLQFFNASFNHFEGAIPATGFFQSLNVTRDSFLGNPGLCGPSKFVSQECSGPMVQSRSSCKGFLCGHIWIPVASSLIVILLLVGGSYGWWRVLGHHKKEGDYYSYLNFGIPGRVGLNEHDLMEIINGEEDNIIGKGAKSTVYRGVLRDGEMFALKVLHADCNDDGEADKNTMEVFLKELHTLAVLRHVNIMKILGFCVTTQVKALILEYIAGGSLHDHLYGDANVCRLSFGDRFKIIYGVAQALVYLHESFHDPIIHRDLKPGNILLGKDLEPKVGDFGISKVATSSCSEKDMVATASSLCGTVGYIPPEYATESRVSTKGDVYSYGVILLEILTRRKPTVEDSFGSHCSLVEFVLKSFEDAPFELLDQTLKDEGKANSLAKDQMLLVLRIGLLCTRATPKSRPAMKDVVEMLNQIKDIACETPALRSVEDLASEISGWSALESADEVVSINSS